MKASIDFRSLTPETREAIEAMLDIALEKMVGEATDTSRANFRELFECGLIEIAQVEGGWMVGPSEIGKMCSEGDTLFDANGSIRRH